MRNTRSNNVVEKKETRRGRLKKWLSGFLAVSTAMTMFGGNVTALMADEGAAEYALAGDGSGEDITIHFGDEDDQIINIHVNPETGTEETAAPADLSAETDTETETESDTETDTETETESDTEAGTETGTETETESGQEKVEAGDLVTISSVDGSLLPNEAEASAEIVTGKAEDKAVERVEAVADAAPSPETVDSGASAEPAAKQVDSGNDAAPAEKTEEAANTEEPESAGKASVTETEVAEKTEYQVFEISLDNVDEEQYQDGFRVEVKLPEEVTGRDFILYHFHDDEDPVEIPVETVGSVDRETGLEVVSGFEFVTEGFSKFILKYTVDLHYKANGRKYEISMPGGGYVSFCKLMEVLNINNATYNADSGNSDDENASLTGEESGANNQDETTLTLDSVTVSDATREFVHDVESVVFSSPEFVDVSKAENETTVGDIKESRGLEIQYSTGLTEEQIEKINSTIVEPGDWALISLQPFESEETLTVTMKNGDAFTIRVTDAQIKKTVIDARGDTWEITVTYNEEAEIPEGAELRVREILPEDKEYEEYYQQSLEKVGVVAVSDTTQDRKTPEVSDEDTAAETTSEESSDSTYAHIFDIQIWADDHEIQPASDVSVSIKLLDAPEKEDTDLRVVHFGKDGLKEMELTGEGEETGEKAGGTELNFVTDEFSVYAIVEGLSLSGLTDRPYGLMTWTGGKAAKALMAVENTGDSENGESYPGCLEAKFLTVMTKENHAGNKLYVPNDTSDTVTMWTFEPADGSNYYLKADTRTDTGTHIVKYLRITDDGLSLVDEPDNACRIQVKLGTGNNKGQICLKSAAKNGKTLTYSGVYAQGYNVGGTPGSEWLYLVDTQSEETLSGYEKVYTATKVSVSDTEHVKTGEKIIIYARQWKNDHYEYFAINSKGTLVPCTESGDTIEWYGGNVNDMLWQFTEYVYEGTDTPNGYYELENLYARSNGDPSYLAPRYADGSFLSGDTIGVLLQGRTDKQYYSPIVAWDDHEYMYSALTVDLNEADPVLKSCVRADGLDFYFAIIEDLPVDDTLHTVPTVDNSQYGITMKMVDLENGKDTADLTGQMNAFLNNSIKNGKTWEHTPGLLSTNLTNGYPTTMKSGGKSLADLFSGERTVNHLFIDSTYRATGYFEYDSAQNFASLQGSDFVVYQELGSNDTTKKDTLQHGQFFPYNDIEAGRFTSVNRENLYSTTADLLPDSNPRKHEQLYLVKDDTDYFFAMELEAGFVQTPSGLDAWGHDIIFEFSGDDDFWLYVDDELVIDLGGIHSAVTGTVNFRTGQVVVNPKSQQHGKTTTLLDLFVDNYMARDTSLSREDALESARRIFKENDAGQWVFNDNTKHTMRIFYMERGAGASNLHMKFNLASAKKDTVELSKKLEGVSKSDTSNALFPYQVYYTMENDTETERMLRNMFAPGTETTEEYEKQYGKASDMDYVFYKDTTKPVTFLPELEVDGVRYYNVFMLKPDETAVLNFPTVRDGETGTAYTVGRYRIVECGIDPTVFTKVTVNNEVITGKPISLNSELLDYGIGMASTDDRPKVNYVNKVETLQSLTLTKELYRKDDAETDPVKVNPDGSPIAAEAVPASQRAADETFGFRLYFKTPYDNDFTPANLHIYHVKDPEGYYCTWNPESGLFEKITSEKYPGYLGSGYESGTKDYTGLTDDAVDANGNVTHLGKFWASFETSPNGSISGIPAYYTVEVRDLIPGTEYRIIERPDETPDGYQFYEYQNNELDENSHFVTHTDPYDPWDGIQGSIKTGQDSWAYVKNYKGYGLRLEKEWEDASSVQDRDPAYFAVYKVGSDGAPDALVPGSARQLKYTSDPKKQQLYWWYPDLPFEDTVLSDYAVFEVKLNGGRIAVDDNGAVTGYESITPVLHGGIVTMKCTLTEEDQAKEIPYKVTYAAPNDISDNVRAFKVTNSPADLPPVRFVKTDWSEIGLPGAEFSLRYGTDLSYSLFDKVTKTSDENGLIAQVYLQENVEYKLTELKSPQGYVGIDGPLTVTLESTKSDWELKVRPENPAVSPACYKVTREDGVLTLIVKNHPYDFKAIKVDSTNTDVKEGAEFDLYKQVTDGGITDWDKDPFYKGLKTDQNGVIPKINKELPAGTYQLRETDAPSGYSKLAGNINFTVSETGVITIGEKPAEVKFSSVTDESEETGKNTTYLITIPNTPLPLMLVKADENGNNLAGAKFNLKISDKDKSWVDVKDKKGETRYNDIDMTSESEFQLSGLPDGLYRLEETFSPAGYNMLKKPVYFKIKSDRIVELTREDGTENNDNTQASISQNKDTGVYTITVRNTPGVHLPGTGGTGRRWIYLTGLMLIALAGAGIILVRRRRELL